MGIGTVAYWRYNDVSLSRDLARPRDMLDHIKVSYRPTKFGGNRHSGSGDIMVFSCHVTLQKHVINESCDLICRSQLR